MDRQLGMNRNKQLTHTKKKGFFYEIRKNNLMYIMLLPTFIFFLVNNYLPIVGIYYAFTNFNFNGGLFGSPFIGFQNFKFLFSSGTLAHITANTIFYNLAFILLGNTFAIFFAILFNEVSNKMFKKITQSIIFLPHFVSYVILGVIVYNLFNFDIGFLNTTLRSLHMQPVDVYNTPWVWRYLIVFFQLWKTTGYNSVIYLAAIMSISHDYYEAAEIDGVNVLQKIWHITIPMLKPTFIILLLFSLGGILKGQFDLFYQLIGNNGILYNATDIIDTYVFRSLKVTFDVGMGTAAGLYQSLIGFVLIMTVNYIVKKINSDYALF